MCPHWTPEGGENVQITIVGSPKEIAAFALGLQGRQDGDEVVKETIRLLQEKRDQNEQVFRL